MKMDWNNYIDHTINVTLFENYGVVYGDKKDGTTPNFYEIVFKTGKLVAVFDDAILLEAVRDNQLVRIYIPFSSVKCVEIF